MFKPITNPPKSKAQIKRERRAERLRLTALTHYRRRENYKQKLQDALQQLKEFAPLQPGDYIEWPGPFSPLDIRFHVNLGWVEAITRVHMNMHGVLFYTYRVRKRLQKNKMSAHVVELKSSTDKPRKVQDKDIKSETETRKTHKEQNAATKNTA